jgi:hypothetical protein
VSFDSSSDNGIGRPYVIQKRLPGLNFNDLMKDPNVAQMKSATKGITELVSAIAADHAASGDISADNQESSTIGPVRTNRFNVPDGDVVPSVPQASFEHILQQCETWREFQVAEGYCFEAVWDGVAAISKALERRGFLEGPCFLVHIDLRE